MRKREIDRKLDEIIDFSGVERYIDTPVKRYSSGMYVRLAFAVAAHLESEILIVDEVLAVGDAEFQKKCLGKMGEVSKGEGRTVLFVSHNMAAVRNLCINSILLKNGSLFEYNDSKSVIELYSNLELSKINEIQKYDEIVTLDYFNFSEGGPIFELTQEIIFRIDYHINQPDQMPDLSFIVEDLNNTAVFQSVFRTNNYSKGKKTHLFTIPPNLLNNGKYIITMGISTLSPVTIHLTSSIFFEVVEDYSSLTRNNNYKGDFHGVVRPIIKWE